MQDKKILILLGLVFSIIAAVALVHVFEDLPEAEVGGPAIPAGAIPSDFDWKAYVDRYEDLRKAGINTEEKAKQHWLEWGKNEGRDYRALKPPPPANTTPAKTSDKSISADLPHFDPAGFRERYNQVLEQADIKTKKDAMEFSLAFWEKKRRAYFS